MTTKAIRAAFIIMLLAQTFGLLLMAPAGAEQGWTLKVRDLVGMCKKGSGQEEVCGALFAGIALGYGFGLKRGGNEKKFQCWVEIKLTVADLIEEWMKGYGSLKVFQNADAVDWLLLDLDRVMTKNGC